MTQFNNRVFGAAIVKAINSNYNADFSGQPRTLPSGQVYATDKAFKYTVKNYLKNVYGEKIFYFKKLKESFNPMSLDEKFEDSFPSEATTKDKKVVSGKLLSCIDVRMFGATYANKAKKINVSIHGPVQINHGINIWHENNIYSEQITAPFGDPKKKSDSKDGEFDEAAMTTIGRQSKLEEGHYLHHFSVNPRNIKEVVELAGEGTETLTQEDINKLKEAMRRGATLYDSAAKAGTENELLIWIQLSESSKLVLPNLAQLISMKEEKKDGKVIVDFIALKKELDKIKDDVELLEIFRNDSSIILENLPEQVNVFSL